ncbi:hypothetical protein [Antarcticirhabdus aurantiaca]|nr:hypothetical protein [Antarcticirhabdus aurantiaca]
MRRLLAPDASDLHQWRRRLSAVGVSLCQQPASRRVDVTDDAV